ncbi:MAG: thiamine pyrophosphate-binding protein [Armatimonadota bacterium]
MQRVSDYVFAFLAGRGVRHVFVLTGGGAMHLDDSLGRCEAIEYTCFLHEQALAVAAESYAQNSGCPGVGLVTSGPGSTNAITGVAAAFIDSTPCVLLSGQAKRADLKGESGVRQMGSQEVDIVSMVSCITKYAVTVMEPGDIRYHLERAWHEATTGRMGPVWLDIPLDVQGALVDEDALGGYEPDSGSLASADVRPPVTRVIDLLNAAERPLILAGNGVRLAGAEALLVDFAESADIPVLLTWKAIDFLDHDHPLNFGSPGIMGCRGANFMVQNCDLLLVLGSRLEPSVTAFNQTGFGLHAKKVMIDIDVAEIRKMAGIDVPVVADAGDFLRSLTARRSEIVSRGRGVWLAYCRDLKRRYPIVLEEHDKGADGVDIYAFTDQLFKQLTAEDVITPESSGAAGEVTYQAMRVKKGQRIRNAAGLGAMGFGLPYSIGACLAADGRRTVLINGDGAFQLNIQELETVKRLRLPIKMFVLENDNYGSIMATQRNMFGGFYVGSESGSGLTLPDTCAVAAAYGIRASRVTSQDELPDAIARTLEGADPALCGVRVTRAHVTAPRVQATKSADGGMVSKPLHDMWPYLPADEVAANMIAELDKETS